MSATGGEDCAHELPSLFVVALPRSLSTQVFERARMALGLAAPTWTSAGEILNRGRWRMLTEEHDGDRFTTESDPARFEHWSGFLDDVVHLRGHAYKDVVQPFMAANWLTSARGRRVHTLRVRRPLADVAWSMLQAGWRYPASVAKAGDDTDRLLAGLLRARDALARLVAVDIDFDALLQHPGALEAALARLYPQIALPALVSDDADFRAYSAAVLARRSTPLWRELEARGDALASA